MKAYIQKLGDHISDDYAFNAYLGFSNMGYEIITFENIQEVPIGKHIVIGCIEDTIKYFNRLGIKVPNALNIPECLNSFKYLKRKISYSTLNEFIINDHCPIFIKPKDNTKSFPSGVLKSDKNKKLLLGSYDLNQAIMLSEIKDIVSEYRVFISNSKIIGMKHYSGDYFIYPNNDFIKETFHIMNESIDKPISYTLDFGVTDNEETLFIEANDAWSIGSYGLDAKEYSMFLLRRWNELLLKNKII